MVTSQVSLHIGQLQSFPATLTCFHVYQQALWKHQYSTAHRMSIINKMKDNEQHIQPRSDCNILFYTINRELTLTECAIFLYKPIFFSIQNHHECLS